MKKIYFFIFALTLTNSIFAQYEWETKQNTTVAAMLNKVSNLYKEEKLIYEKIDSMLATEKLPELGDFDRILFFLVEEPNPLAYEILIRNNKKFSNRIFHNVQQVFDGVVYPIQQVILANLDCRLRIIDYIYYSHILDVDLETTGNLKFFKELFGRVRGSGKYNIQGCTDIRLKNLSKLIDW